MKTVQQELQVLVNAALGAIDGAGAAADLYQVVPCANAQFGDYQWNGALSLARTLRTNPRALAQKIADGIDIRGICKPVEIAGPGFINFRLEQAYIELRTLSAVSDERLGVPPAEQPRSIVIDYPSPNVAKPLHVGHIRTMFIGDAIARLLRFKGHRVISDNHIGDWGTPIGKVIFGWNQHADEAAFAAAPLEEMGRLYKLVNDEAAADATVNEKARAETARLQAGDATSMQLWNRLREASQRELDDIYARLDIHIDETLGESFYQSMLADVIADLQAKGIATPSQGALVVQFETPDLADHPMLVQKSDGAALYSTTDLATIRYRVERWNPDEIIYVVDIRQALHFQQVFQTARLWGYGNVALRHVTFGTILGENGSPIKTRSGESIKLVDLLDEAEARALEAVREKNNSLDEAQALEVARVVGLGSVKYADLSPNRTSDYTFSWDKMLALNGNTAPYLLNAYVRIQSIFRRAAADGIELAVPAKLELADESELELARFLLRYALAIDASLADYRVNALTDYLFELAHKFHGFYEKCPVLTRAGPARSSRLALCRLTAAILQHGLGLLGIGTIEQM
jgi:arginyl-tRNA synthetase